MNAPIGLIDMLTRMCYIDSTKNSINKVIDDLPPLSIADRSMKIWRDILEFNSSCLVRCLPNPSKKINRRQLSIELRIWLCSLNYQRGTDALEYLFGEDFIENHIDLFLINLNYDPVKSLVSHRLENRASHILDSTLSIRVQYLKTINPRFSHLITQEEKIISWIDNYDDITDSLCFFLYYLCRLNVRFKFPFETYRSYIRYTQYAIKKRYVGGLMASPMYREVIQYLVANLDINQLIEYNLMEGQFFNMDAFEMCSRIIPGVDEDWIKKNNPRLVNGVSISVLRHLHDRSTCLSSQDMGIIHERLVTDQIVLYDSERTYLCWSHLKIDNLYLSSVLMYLKIWRREDEKIYFRVKSSNILEQCGTLLREIQDQYVDVHIDLDYENTPSDILYDLILNGNFLREEVKTLIVYHKDELLKTLTSDNTKVDRVRTNVRRPPVPASRGNVLRYA